jgi:PAS domain S-box-containing protein
MENIYPENEKERLKALKEYAILDSLSEESFNRITELASLICETEISAISLIDSDRQWFKSIVGIEATETPRNISFCQHAILQDSYFEIENASEDTRFQMNPLVIGEPNIKFYGGYPLKDPFGYNIGTLCVIDSTAKKLNQNQEKALKVLAAEVMAKIVARKKEMELNNFKILFDLSIDMICIAGTNGYFKHVNHAFVQTLGWSQEELLENPFINFVHPADINSTIKEIEKLSQGEKTIQFINHFKTKNGEYKSLEWVANPDINTGELYAIARDVSENLEKEAHLKLTNSRFKNLLQNLQEGVLIENAQREIVLTNSKMCAMFGIPVSPEQLIGADCSESAEQNKHLMVDEKGFVDTINKILYEKKIVTNEVLALKDGRFFERDYVPIFIDHQYNGHLWKYRDISENRKNQLDLIKAKDELNVIFETINEGIVVQKKTGEIINFNPAACSILKLEADNLLGKKSIDPDWKSIHEDGSDFPGETHPAMVALQTGESVYNVIMGVRIKEGLTTWININAELLPNKEFVVCSFTDITEQKEIEQQRLKVVQLEASNKIAEQSLRAKEEFLTNMSHEIRTPMNSIIGLSRLLYTSGELNTKQKNYLDIIHLNSNNLLGIINDILDYSKLEAGKLEIDYSDIALKKLLENTLKSVEILAENKSVSMYRAFDERLPNYLIGDSIRITQILTNLLTNAIKFTEQGSVSLEINEIKKEENFSYVQFKVTDTGIGISKENIVNILQPFTQATSSTTRKFGGTGLGLSIVGKLLELMGSKLHISSEIDLGSEFSFELRMQHSKVQPNTNKKDINRLTGSYSILLVEDNLFNQIVAKDTLEDWNNNFKISIANNGEEAVELVNSNNFDLILMDIQMPVMDGYVATQTIRNHTDSSKANIPIIAMTANVSSLEKDKCIAKGMNDYLSKPFEQEDLYQIISKWIVSEEKEQKTNSKTNTIEKETIKNSIDYSRTVNTDFITEFTKGNVERIEKMVTMFIDTTPKELEGLLVHLENKDYPSLGRLAHSFKAKYTYMGMPELSDIVKEIELNAKAEKMLDELGYMISVLQKKTEGAIVELQNYLREIKK